MARYQGRITKMNQEKGFGWIGLSTVTEKDGTPADIATTKDIYFHAADCQVNPRVDMEVAFDIVNDSRRERGYRASGITAVRPVTIPAGIDIHVDARVVDNPGVPMRWCFTRETHARIIEGLSKGYGYAVMLVAKNSNDEYNLRQVREVHRWKQPFTIFTFPTPGEWEVTAVLYESKEHSSGFRDASSVLQQELREKFLCTRHGSYEASIPDAYEFARTTYPERYAVTEHYTDYGMPVILGSLRVSVPKGIFAPEPPAVLKNYANYFFRQQPDDQCHFRQRLLLMVPGFIPWLLVEGVKRIFVLAFGFVTGLLWLEGSVSIMKHAFKPAVMLTEPLVGNGTAENGRMKPFDKRPLEWFTPGALILYGFVAWLLYLGARAVVPWLLKVLLHNWVGIAIAITAVALILGVIYLTIRVKAHRRNTYWRRRKQKEQLKEQRIKKREEARKALTVERGKREAVLAVRHAPALVCGDAPAEVSLKAIPQELRSTHMLFEALKQQVCRPFAR